MLRHARKRCLRARIASEREEHARGSRQCSDEDREQAENCREREQVRQPLPDEGSGQIAIRRTRRTEFLDSGRIQSVAKRLGDDRDEIEGTHDDDGDLDRAGDVALGVRRLFTEGCCTLEPGKRKKAEDRRASDDADVGAGWQGQKVPRESLATRSRARADADEDDDVENDDEDRTDQLGEEQQAGNGVHLTPSEDHNERQDYDRGPDPVRFERDSEILEQLRDEQPDLDSRPGTDRHVTEQQAPAGDESGPRSEGEADSRIDRPGVGNVSRQLDETICDKGNGDEGEDEGPGRSSAEHAGCPCAEQRHYSDRTDEADRESGGVCDFQLSLKFGRLDVLLLVFHDGSLANGPRTGARTRTMRRAVRNGGDDRHCRSISSGVTQRYGHGGRHDKWDLSCSSHWVCLCRAGYGHSSDPVGRVRVLEEDGLREPGQLTRRGR